MSEMNEVDELLENLCRIATGEPRNPTRSFIDLNEVYRGRRDALGRRIPEQESNTSTGDQRLEIRRRGRRDDHQAERVNNPPHYNTGRIEVIEVIEDWGLGFNMGNAVKYIARADHKGNAIEDLRKAAWYIQRELENRISAEQLLKSDKG